MFFYSSAKIAGKTDILLSVLRTPQDVNIEEHIEVVVLGLMRMILNKEFTPLMPNRQGLTKWGNNGRLLR